MAWMLELDFANADATGLNVMSWLCMPSIAYLPVMRAKRIEVSNRALDAFSPPICKKVHHSAVLMPSCTAVGGK